MMMRHLIALVILVLSARSAQMDGHGPDAWQVTGVAANDVQEFRTAAKGGVPFACRGIACRPGATHHADPT